MMDEKKRSPMWDYGEAPGKHALVAANMAVDGHAERSKKHADKAVQEQDLMHPDLWGQWSWASDASFTAALEHFSPKEARKLEQTRDHHGWDVVVALASSPGKLMALRSAGVDINAPSSLLAGVEVSATGLLAFQGNLRGVDGLRRAGFASPGALGLEIGAKMDKAAMPRTVLHALAASGASESDEDRKSKVLATTIAWLCEGAPISARDGRGRDALKIAIDNGNAEIACALIDAGADPRPVDAKGRDAMATLDRRTKAMQGQSKTREARALALMRSKLLSVLERLEMGAATSSETPVPVKRRSL